MYINPINNINFCAKVLKEEIPILAKNGQNSYQQYNAKLVEFDTNSKADIAKVWEICHMPEFALYGYELPESLSSANLEGFKRHCYALVKGSENNYSNIDKNNVLGIFTVNEAKEKDVPNQITLFMTNLRYRTRWYQTLRDKDFYHVGEGMAMTAINDIFPMKSFFCSSELGSVNFWKKIGFKEIVGQEQKLILKR